LQTLSAKLTVEFSHGFSQRNLASMVRFAEFFPDLKIVQSVITQLQWIRFKSAVPLEESLLLRQQNWPTAVIPRLACPEPRSGDRGIQKRNWMPDQVRHDIL
jgi:hypothetical protein